MKEKIIEIQGLKIRLSYDGGIYKPQSSDVASIAKLPLLKEIENSKKFFVFMTKGQYQAANKWVAINSDLRGIVAKTSIIKFLVITLGCLLTHNDEATRIKHFNLFKKFISGITDNLSKQLSDEVIVLLLKNEGFNTEQLNTN